VGTNDSIHGAYARTTGCHRWALHYEGKIKLFEAPKVETSGITETCALHATHNHGILARAHRWSS
jgi:hypothetical protein